MNSMNRLAVLVGVALVTMSAVECVAGALIYETNLFVGCALIAGGLWNAFIDLDEEGRE